MRLLKNVTWCNEYGENIPLSLQEFNGYLYNLACGMINNGWTVIGSVYKTPKLTKWRACSKQESNTTTLHNLQIMRANSINIRLEDSNVIALDCDFNDEHLMSRFVLYLRKYLCLSKDQIYTCSGKKGGKIFFRVNKFDFQEKIPLKLGKTAYTKGHPNDSDYKQELEVKTLVSTCAGLYGIVDNEMVIYGEYDDYPYICHARPEDLPLLKRSDLAHITRIFESLCCEANMCYEDGNPCIDAAEKRRMRAFLGSILCGILMTKLNNDPIFLRGKVIQYPDIREYIEKFAYNTFLCVGQINGYQLALAMFNLTPITSNMMPYISDMKHLKKLYEDKDKYNLGKEYLLATTLFAEEIGRMTSRYIHRFGDQPDNNLFLTTLDYAFMRLSSAQRSY